MTKHSEIILLSHQGCNQFNGEYTNTAWARKRTNGKYTVWIFAQGIDFNARDCWHKNITTPETFVQACLDCFAFADFGDAGFPEIFHKILPRLKKLDRGFAAQVERFLTNEHRHEIGDSGL